MAIGSRKIFLGMRGAESAGNRQSFMRFFTDPSEYTHRARFYGMPCYFRSDGFDGARLAGTNCIFDWIIQYIWPPIHWLCDGFLWLADPSGYEPSGWQIEILYPLRETIDE